QGPLQQQVHTGADEHADGEHQRERGAHLDVHESPPSPVCTSSGSVSSAVLRGESCATSGAAWPAASPCRSTSEPSERSTSSISPTTTRNTPMSKNSEVTRCTSPSTHRWKSNCTDCSTTPPKNSGTAPAPADRNRPEPSSAPGRTGIASPSSYRPPAR